MVHGGFCAPAPAEDARRAVGQVLAWRPSAQDVPGSSGGRLAGVDHNFTWAARAGRFLEDSVLEAEHLLRVVEHQGLPRE